MPYVIAEPCIAVCDTACVAVCPIDCIHGPLSPADIAALKDEERATRLTEIQMYIDPDACISCGACEGECPVGAIFDDDELPPKWASYLEKNARFFER